MKLHWINQTGNTIDGDLQAIREVMRDLPVTETDGGVPVRLTHCDKGLQLTRTPDGWALAYADRTALMRAVGLLGGGEKLPDTVEETPAFTTLGTMVDCSRNSVPTVDTVKRLCRILARMGFNTLMLYTEDTYELPGHPYFGYMRGRYSAEELQECDAYAAELGIELIPCIQTLAHLNAALRWPEFSPLVDCNDILLADDERTYVLIDEMVGAMASHLRSRRIHIGMDEAHMLGLGEHLRRHGYQSPTEIMLRHLRRVVEICKKHGYEPIMWSDMFFRLGGHGYYDRDNRIGDAVIRTVPKEVTLTYWDYYQLDESVYDYMIEQHQRFPNPLLFAGGAWAWLGLLPIQRFSLASSRKALSSLRRHGVTQAIVTVWGDNGGVCPPFSVMPTVQLYAEACWRSDLSDENLAPRLHACADMDFEAFMDLETPQFLPGRDPEDVSAVNPARYLFYQDVLCGLFDRHVQPGTAEHFARCARQLTANRKKCPRWGYLFDTAAAFCRVLELKADMGVRLKAAYDAKDRQTLDTIANRDIPRLLKRLENFQRLLFTQWTTDFKVFGMDVQDIRIGGVRARVERAAARVNDYLAGRIDAIDELTQERLYYDGRGEGEDRPLFFRQQSWHDAVTPGVL